MFRSLLCHHFWALLLSDVILLASWTYMSIPLFLPIFMLVYCLIFESLVLITLSHFSVTKIYTGT